MSAAQKVEQVLAEHQRRQRLVDGAWTHVCLCGGWSDGEPFDDRSEAQEIAHRAHVAEQIVAALGEPTVEYGVRWGVDGWDDERCDDRDHAESLIVRWPNGGGVLVTRTVHTGEWQEADRGE